MTGTATHAGSPDTIVLIHGLWMTPKLGTLISRYSDRGYCVIAPAYPGLEVEVEAARDPSPIEKLTVPAVVTHLGVIVSGLDRRRS
jgi:hypothetical protein